MSVLQDLKQEIRKLKTSDPVFSVRKETGGWAGVRLVLRPTNAALYPKNVPDYADPIGGLARMFHRETFNVNLQRFTVDEDSILGNIRSEVKNWMLSFVRSHSENAEMLRWYDYYALGGSVFEKVYFESMLGIYKYMLLHEHAADKEKHQTNVVGLLELIYQRDFKENQLPQQRRRRRRRRR